MRNFLVVLLFVFYQTASITAAQSNPTVEIILSQLTAHQGDIVSAEVWVRNATYVGGLDIGITVDETCLHILDRQPGGYLPTTDAEGAFSAFSSLNDHDTRLAAALANRTKNVSGDGVFYRVQLETTCAQGIAAINVSRAQVSTYIDPEAAIIHLTNYEMDKGTLNVTNAQLTIGPGDQVTAVPTTASEFVPTQTPEAAPEQDASAPKSNMGIIVALGLAGAGILLLGIAFWLMRRNRMR